MTDSKLNLHLTFDEESAAFFIALSAALSASGPNELDLRNCSRPHVTLCRTNEHLDMPKGLPCRVQLTCGSPYVSSRNGRHILVPVRPAVDDAALVRQTVRQASKTSILMADIRDWHVSIGYLTTDPTSALARLPGFVGREVWTTELQLATSVPHGGLGQLVTQLDGDGSAC